jgi:ribonuclease P protein component
MAPPRGTKVGHLTRRPEFLAVAGARRKWVAPGLILQARSHDDQQRPADGQPPIRLGLTASRKVGNAVERNRARRRLRAAAAAVLPLHASPDYDIVLIARRETLSRPFVGLKTDVATALQRLGAWRDDASGAGVA